MSRVCLLFLGPRFAPHGAEKSKTRERQGQKAGSTDTDLAPANPSKIQRTTLIQARSKQDPVQTAKPWGDHFLCISLHRITILCWRIRKCCNNIGFFTRGTANPVLFACENLRAAAGVSICSAPYLCIHINCFWIFPTTMYVYYDVLGTSKRI